jgi:Family of unknown function (DUF6151)
MEHPLRCRCGTIRGWVKDPRAANRALCYCKDCQAFARFLGQENEILDAQGGTDVIQILPKNLTFTQGLEALACIRLTNKGMLRWYASCCNSPIGNTLPNFKISFIGLVHNCLEGSEMSLQNSFGAVRACVNTQGAKADPKPKSRGAGAIIVWFISTVLRARLNGSYKQTPFFLKDKGTPIVRPHVLNSVELADVMAR